ncbi:hypothetical protein EVAR_97537_1 [Eumeta japonica]|uniref:Uncharacterized protein n=1 Tax=Eumeta variegata TaxID=151549 RepID=A0A4C1WPN6_EUMVA|nr:hypothetical protein EVAR_97537_1 [Eumeta japonica]
MPIPTRPDSFEIQIWNAAFTTMLALPWWRGGAGGGAGAGGGRADGSRPPTPPTERPSVVRAQHEPERDSAHHVYRAHHPHHVSGTTPRHFHYPSHGTSVILMHTIMLCAAAVSLLLGRIGRWSGREISRAALSLARSAQAERDNESCFFLTPSSILYPISTKETGNAFVTPLGSRDHRQRWLVIRAVGGLPSNQKVLSWNPDNNNERFAEVKLSHEFSEPHYAIDNVCIDDDTCYQPPTTIEPA